MWLLIPEFIIFILWPLLLAVVLLLLKFLTKRNVFQRLAIGVAVLNVVWIVFLQLSSR